MKSKLREALALSLYGAPSSRTARARLLRNIGDGKALAIPEPSGQLVLSVDWVPP